MLLNKAKAQSLMSEADIDVLVMTYTENNIYFGDFLHVNSAVIKSRPYYTIFFAREDQPTAYLVPHQDIDDVKRATWIEDVRATAEYLIPGREQVIWEKEKAVAQILAERGLTSGRVGFENASVYYDVHRRLQEELTGFELVPASDLIAKLRAIKSPEEPISIPWWPLGEYPYLLKRVRALRCMRQYKKCAKSIHFTLMHGYCCRIICIAFGACLKMMLIIQYDGQR